MNSGEDDEIIEILDAREGRTAVQSAAEFPWNHPELRILLEAADVAWASMQDAPALEDDPVAAMLGLVPDPSSELDGRALTTARKRAGLSVSSLAQRLGRRGWEVSTKELFAWETGRNSPRTPALIKAIAEEVEIDPDRLRRTTATNSERSKLAAIVESGAFRELVERWAHVQGTTLALAASALESRMMVTVHRGEIPDERVLLDSLEALVASVEGRHG